MALIPLRRKSLKLMNKTFQKPETIYAVAEKCLQAGIRPSFNVIFGFPGEGEKERRETISLIMDVCRRYPGAEFWTNIFTPYPGAPIVAARRGTGDRFAQFFRRMGRLFPAAHRSAMA